MKLKIALTFLTLSLCAAAQTFLTNVPGIGLSGSVSDPVLVNHSGKPVVAAMVSLMSANGTPWVDLHIFANNLVTGVPDGGSARAGGRGKHQKFTSPIVSARVHAVIFADGEFRGEDGENFLSRAESSMQAMRQMWQLAKAGEWTSVKAYADRPVSDPSADIYAWNLAVRLLALKVADGADKAVSDNAFFGNLPASTWKAGGLLNRLEFPDWLRPLTAYAQSLPFNNVLPWPQGTGMDAWHPNPWTYTCTTFVGYSNPCPPLRGGTPAEGIKANCISGSYEIGDKIIIYTDDSGTPSESTSASSTANNGGYLYNKGACYDFPTRATGTESWEYDKSCNGADHPTPLVFYDTTGVVCGVAALGWGQ